jgi:hypothetical protein
LIEQPKLSPNLGLFVCRVFTLPSQDPVHSKFLVKDAITPFMSMGGVRIEDNVVITETSSLSLTDVPRTIKEIEAVMAGAHWPFAGVRDTPVDDSKNSIAGVAAVPGIAVV